MSYTIASSQLVVVGVGLLVLTAIGKVVYNLYFHPLAKFPGPKLAAISQIWYSKNIVKKENAYAIHQAHLKHGEVVRIAPDELSFATLQSWKDIYGHAGKGHTPFLKGSFYDRPDIQSGIVFERDPAKHREVRKNLSYAFSAKALQGQETIVQTYVDMFVGQIRRLGTQESGINVAEWFNWLTFDVIGDLAFGDSFGAVENARTHFWVSILMNGSFASALADVFNRFPIVRHFIPSSIIFKKSVGARETHMRYVKERVSSRMTKENNRPDFFSHLLSDKTTNISEPFLMGQAHILLLAGSETTATTLTGMSYFITKNPEIFARLSKEVRGAFTEEDQIGALSTQHLPYLHAVIEESLRIFPPVSVGLQRISPGAEIDGYYVPRGFHVSTHMYGVSHSSTYFHEPDAYHPERWLPHNHEYYSAAFANDSLDAAKPFSTGPRVCLGINLAYMEMKIAVAKMVWNFDWELVDPNMKWKPKVATLWEKPETMVRFKPVVRV